MAQATHFGDISLSGIRFRIDAATWREKDIIDFAPRATVPGGSVIMSDLGLYQPLVQTSWQHGFGFHWYSDAEGYLSTTGSMDTRHEGLIMMHTAKSAYKRSTYAAGTVGQVYGYVTFNGVLYSYGSFGLEKYSGGAWSNLYNTAAVNYAINAGTYLLLCPDGLRIKKMSTAEAFSDAGLDANSTDYRWLVIHNGLIYAGKDGTNRIHTDSNEDLSQLEGTTADTDIIYCGVGNVPTLGAIEYAGELYVSRQDGLWHVGEDRICRRVLDYSGEPSANNFKGMTVINGYLVFPVRSSIIQWNGARVQDITPNALTDSFPYTTYGSFTGLVSTGNYMYCLAKTNESTYTISLLCWDGVTWFKLSDITSSATAIADTVGYDVTNNYIWIAFRTASSAGTVYDQYIRMQDNSAFPYADFPTTGTHDIITSRLDTGFRRVQKSAPSLLVEARNVNTSTYIRVYYQLDGSGTWVHWDDIKTSGIIELTLPGGHKTVEFNYIQLKFVFVTSVAAQSPILEGYTLRFIMRPDVLWGYSFYVLAGTSMQAGDREDDRTSAEIRSQLLTIRDSKAPVELVDMIGKTHTGYLTAIQGAPSMRTPGGEDSYDDVEMRYLCNFASLEKES